MATTFLKPLHTGKGRSIAQPGQLWLLAGGENKPLTNRQKLEQMIDSVLTSDCKSYEDFPAAMWAAEAEVKTGKHLAFKIPEGKRFIRCDSLSKDYTEDAIWERLKGRRNARSRQNRRASPPRKIYALAP